MVQIGSPNFIIQCAGAFSVSNVTVFEDLPYRLNTEASLLSVIGYGFGRQERISRVSVRCLAGFGNLRRRSSRDGCWNRNRQFGYGARKNVVANHGRNLSSCNNRIFLVVQV